MVGIDVRQVAGLRPLLPITVDAAIGDAGELALSEGRERGGRVRAAVFEVAHEGRERVGGGEAHGGLRRQELGRGRALLRVVGEAGGDAICSTFRA